MPEILELPESDLASAPPEAPLTTKSSASQLPVYAITIFLSAALLFQVQLIFAKHILPLFGGVPSIWNTCMFCFQVLLLLGYAYAHVLKLNSKSALQGKIHGALLLVSAVVMLALWFFWGTPLTPGVNWKPSAADNPVLKILEVLG